VRVREPDHLVRSDAVALRSLLPSREGPSAHFVRDPEVPLRCYMAGTAAVALCPAGPSRRPRLRDEGEAPTEEELQLHWRPEGLRDLPPPIPDVPVLRLHSIALGGDFLRTFGSPDD